MVGIFILPNFEGFNYVDGVLFIFYFNFLASLFPIEAWIALPYIERTLANFGKGKLKRHCICSTWTFLSHKILSVLMSSLVDKLIASQCLKTLTLIVQVSLCVVNAFSYVYSIFFEALRI